MNSFLLFAISGSGGLSYSIWCLYFKDLSPSSKETSHKMSTCYVRGKFAARTKSMEEKSHEMFTQCPFI